MHTYVISITWLAIGISHCAPAQSISTLTGARAHGLGYAASCLADEWSLYNNPGGLGDVEHAVAAAAYNASPALPAADRVAAVVALPTKYGVAGLGTLRFGDNVYSEHIVSAGFSNRFGITSLGAKVNYVQYNAEGFGTKGVVSVSLGGITALTPRLTLGMHIINLNQPAITADGDERLPTVLIAGFAFEPTEKLFITTEIEKDLEYDPLWKAGLEYRPFTRAAFRTGINLHPNAAFFGTGLQLGKLTIDYALQYATIPGLSHQAAVSYRLKTMSE